MVSPMEPVKCPSRVVPPKDSLLPDILPPNSSSASGVAVVTLIAPARVFLPNKMPCGPLSTSTC